MEDLRNGAQHNVHLSRPTFYRDQELEIKAIMNLVLTSDTERVLYRRLCPEVTLNGRHVRVRLVSLPVEKNTLEPICLVQEDVPYLLQKLPKRKYTPT